jgi:outer membrane protein OmpA-like peptidoglycan-associated protein
MTTMSEINRSRWRSILLAVTAVLATASPALPQSSSSGNSAKPFSDEGEYSTWEIGGFFGTQWFQRYQGSTAQRYLLLTKPIIGVRVTEDLGRYYGVEETFGVGFNRLAMLPYGGSGYATVSEYNYQIAVHGLLYLTPRTSLYRPFIDFGPTAVIYDPAKASSLVQPTVGIPATVPASLNAKIVPGFDYGIGIKMPLRHRWETRIDLMGLWTPAPDFGLPNSTTVPGTLFIPTQRGENAWRFTVEFAYRGGFHEPPPPVAAAPPPPPPPPPPPSPPIQVQAISGARDVCPGDNLPLRVTANGGPAGATLTYQWFVNDQAAAGGTGQTFNLPTTTSGTKAVRVAVSGGGMNATSSTVNVLVKILGPPTVQFTVSPNTINYGDRLPLNATAMGSDCGGPATLRYTASEGTIAGTTFDSTGVSFDMSNRLKQQSKVVRLTATATDTKGQTANANGNVTVNLKPAASRQDIVFANRSSRVNNAAKRYLIEQLTPRLRDDPNSSVILIGHRDMSETGRANATLDTQRVLNTAAVLSAGKGVCPSLDLSRVQVSSAGTDQTAPPMPFGDASVKERSGESTTDQRAQFRRVEVWFVPGGADKPALSGLQPAPAKEIQAKGCPK